MRATIETQARTFCDALLEHKDLPDRWKGIPGSNALTRLAKALKLAGLEAKLPEGFWLTARQIEQIRHCIAHANGEVGGSRHEKSLRALVDKFPWYQLDAENRILLDQHAGVFAIQVFVLLFTLLYEQAQLPGMPLPEEPDLR